MTQKLRVLVLDNKYTTFFKFYFRKPRRLSESQKHLKKPLKNEKRQRTKLGKGQVVLGKKLFRICITAIVPDHYQLAFVLHEIQIALPKTQLLQR